MKARVVGAIIAVLLVWPVAHRQLVIRFDVNPWKLFGMAMYCTPHDIAIELRGVDGSRVDPILAADLSAKDRHVLGRFASRRRVLGKLHPPDALAAAILDARPELDALELTIHVFRLPARATRLEDSATSYRFGR